MTSSTNNPGSEETGGSTAETKLSAYLSLKAGQAYKTGQRSQGKIHYRILTDSDRQRLYVTITGNDGGGYYSKEIVPFEHIERCLADITADKAFAARVFQPAFIGQSSNNAGFLAAILRAEQLVTLAPGSLHQLNLMPNWTDWKDRLLALTDQAEPFQPELPKPRQKKEASEKQPHSSPAIPEHSTTPEQSEDALSGADNESHADAMPSCDRGEDDATFNQDLKVAAVEPQPAGKKIRADKRQARLAQDASDDRIA